MDIHKRYSLLGGIGVILGTFGCTSQKDVGTKEAGMAPLSSARWTVQNADKRVALAFDMAEQDGVIAGAIWIADPETGEWLYNGVLSGTHKGSAVEWDSAGLMGFRGTFDGVRLNGDIIYAAWGEQSLRRFPSTLIRETP